jgi:hypothetical protein
MPQKEWVMNKYLNPKKYVGYFRPRVSKVARNFNVLHRRPVDRYLEFEKRIRQHQNHNEQTQLHFGCGPRVLKGWINIDLAFEPYENYLQYYTDVHYPPEIRGDLDDFYALDFRERGLPIPSNSVDLIFHEDFIEHLSQKEQVLFLAETFRVLKAGSIHRINTPHLLTSMQRHSDFEKGFEGVYVEEWDRHVHLNILTPSLLEELARLIGYSKITFTKKNESQARGMLPLEYRPAADRSETDGNIFADLIK